jgi:hypothetical protein
MEVEGMICTKLDLRWLRVVVHLFVGTKTELFEATKKSIFSDVVDLDEDFGGRSIYKDGHFGLQIRRDCLEHNEIAHEVFHITHRIWHYLGHDLLAHSSEPHAYLCGFITDWVYAQLRKARFTVKHQ